MGMVIEALKYPSELYPLLRLRQEVKDVEKKMPKEPHWAFCYSQLAKVSRSFAFFIFQIRDDNLRDAVCILYLILRSLDTIEDDMSIADDIKIPALKSFYLHFSENDWSFPCGEKDFKVLMDNFHYVRTAFLELEKSYQETIVDLAKTMGTGMAKYIHEEVETLEQYNEYCYYVSGVISLYIYDLFTIAGVKNLPSKDVGISVGLFFQKATIIRDYLEDINDPTKPRVYWPKVIWGKYVDKLEDFQKEENSSKALQCLNELVNDALVHVKDCFQCIHCLQDPRIFIPISVPQIAAFGMLALCYNNIQVFQQRMEFRYGLVAKIFWETQTLSDVYNAFYEFSSLLKSKIDMNDSTAQQTLEAVENIQNYCRESGLLNERRFYIYETKPLLNYGSMMVVVLFALFAVFLHTSFQQFSSGDDRSQAEVEDVREGTQGTTKIIQHGTLLREEASIRGGREERRERNINLNTSITLPGRYTTNMSWKIMKQRSNHVMISSHHKFRMHLARDIIRPKLIKC